MESTLKAEVDRDVIRRAVERHLGGELTGVKELGGGRCNTVYEVECTAGTYIMKVAPENARLENQQQLLKEPHLSRLVLGMSRVRVPRVHGASGEAGAAGRAYVLMEKMPGTPLHLAWDTLTVAERERLAGKMGELLADLAEIEAPLFGWIDHRGLLQGFPTWASFFRERGFLRLNYLGFVAGVPADRLLKLKEIAARAIDDPEIRPAFVHGNLANMSNVMVDGPPGQTSIVGVIDLEHAQFADADVELAGFTNWGDFYPLVERAFRRRRPATASWPRRSAIYALLEEIRQMIACFHLTPDKYRASLHITAAGRRVNEILSWEVGSPHEQ
ncbi:MAG: aminoglycoside phosphotransferase family protein [Acetobacteraceae bacterium]|nr:aminoglycoside phosphotransferase family protein [Acetobacteraceae bacterium]